jgi:site-specific DNA-adenine methylase
VFSYYGAKSKLAGKYSAPAYKTIIEPFAGAAKYALHHCKIDPTIKVVLVEKYAVVADVWRWLLQATEDDIRRLPILAYKEAIPDVLPPAARAFLAFMSNQGSERPRNVAGSKGGFKVKSWDTTIRNLPFIKGWEIIEGDYTNAPDIEATWYIDPPYIGQSRYPAGRGLDYSALADWCKSRKGQVVVCENDTATWLPFEKLCTAPGQRSTSKLRNEGVWMNDLNRYAIKESA